MSVEEYADVTVVGAGLAGLVAARDVRRAGLSAIVVEARDRVGGRTWNRPMPDGWTIEAGGQYIGPTQDRLAALAEEVGVETFPTYYEGRTTWRGARTPETFELARPVLDELDRLAAEIPVEAPWQAERAREWDAQTLHTWLSSRVTEPTTMALLRLAFSSVLAAEADELSLLHVLTYIRSAGSTSMLTDVAGGAQERRFSGGSHLLAVRLAERLSSPTGTDGAGAMGGGGVRLGSPVHRIRHNRDGAVVEAAGRLITTRRVIVAVPIALADRIAYEPALPSSRRQLHQRMATGVTIKIHCRYETPFWRADGRSGSALSPEECVSAVFDDSPPDGSYGALIGFVVADRARALARLPAGDRRAAVVGSFVRYFGRQAMQPTHYAETDWSTEDWTHGCYGSNLPPGAWTRYGPALREPVGAIHWAGAETSAIWMNYMDGAVRSGERAAAEVVAALAGTPGGGPAVQAK
ncbi:monoamine oxidase [Thermomonospora echinospora]|uniref:Monoamine oxidase n=1 Tax=Thermomonospora echinospora TaxID=1992 RepID=A0A1H6D105_9ACTN|nr:FAD-dependent oxidoreductase [Thermomonospora echinospora]SEG78718.1 monoamine oxidase [Thermomonospora echinospora]